MKITKAKRILCLFLALGLFLVSVLPVTLAEENAVIEAPIADEYLLDEATACEVEAYAEADNEEPIEQPEETMESEAEPFVESEEVLVAADEPSEQVDSAEPVLSIAEAVDEYGFCYGKITMATDVYSSPGRTDENRSYTLTSSSSIVLVRSIGEMAEIWFAVNNGDVVNGYVEKTTLDDVAISESAMKDTQMVSTTIGNELVDVPVVNANKIEREEQVNTEPPMEEPPVESDETTPDTEAPEAEEPHENVELPETEIDTLQPSDSGELEQNEVIPDSDETNNTIENSSTAEEYDVSEDVASEDTPEAEDGEEDEVVGEVPMMATFAMARSFVPSFKPVYANLGSFTVGQTGVHGSSGDDSYKQLAAAPDYGTVYATPHYLDNVTVYCLEHMFDGPGERTDDGSIGETGPYTIVDLETYYHTPGKSGTIFSSRTMHAIAWVMRHSYPYQVLDLNYADNENWCRAACQFAIRQVIKELEGSQFVRYYWDLDSFYRRADSAPEEYLAYARWLADNAIARASITGKINVTNKSTSISGGKYIYSATFTTDADRIRIEKKYGTMTGNSGGSDDTYYYLLSGDKISITSTTANATIKAESLPAPDEEAFFMVGIPAAWLQKVIIPYTGAPWPYQSISVTFELPYGSLAVVKKDAASSKALKGAVFELLDSSGSVIQTKTTDANGKATFSELPAGSYTVREKAPPEGYTLGSASSQAATVKAGETASLTFKNDLINAKIKIKKIDALTKTPLEGVTFEIKRLSAPTALSNEGVGTSISISTNSEGIAETGWLPWGKYQIVETSCPQHYETPDFSTTIEAYEDGKTYTISVQNEPTKGYIQITKKDELDATPIAGVTFDIFYNDEYGEGLAATMVTDKKGVAVSPALRKGHYIVKEHENPVGYLLDLVSINCSVESDVTTKLTASNCPVRGTIEIHKTDELTGEALAGAEFTITRITGLPSHNGFGEGEVVEVLTTDENGFAKSSLLTWGTYRVEETKVPAHYVDNHYSVDVSITDEVTVCEVDVENEPTKGWISLTKTDRLNGNPIKGVKFDIFYNDAYGEGLAATMTTDANGVAISPPLRKGSYLVKESGVTDGYVFEELNFSAVVHSDETTYLTATNQPVQVQLQIFKRDSEESFGDIAIMDTRGDGILTGAEFQVTAAAKITDRQGNVIYNKGDVVCESLRTDGENAAVLTEPLWPGKYNVVEVTPPTGYQASTKVVSIDATDAAKQSAVAVVTYDAVKTNKILYGAICVVKFLGDNQIHESGVIETPEKGAEFEIYLKSSGSYESARDCERDKIVTNKNGKAKTKALPYGVYVMQQTVGQEGHMLMSPIEFMIDGTEELNDPPTLILNNTAIRYRLRIIKTDAETGKTITLAHTAFKLKDTNGEYVKQSVSYPTPMTIDTFETDENGIVVLPETVKWGHYTIEEVTSPEGYIINSDGVDVFVGHVGDAPEEIYELEVQVPNDPVKGRIVIEKKGNRLVGFETMKDENGMEYMKPVYEYRYLSGVVFDIKAADDVIGKDGTTWYQKGDVVETITTNSEGPVSSSELPLGKYTVEEVQTPDGYYCDPTIYEANLSFVDNQTKVVELQLDIENEYLPIEIHVDKTKDVLRPVTAANEMIHQALSAEPGTGFTFGLYNINTIEYDGGTLEANTLLATATTNDDGKLVFTGYYPHGEYFIRELGGPDGWILSEGRYRVNLQPDMAAEDHVIRVHFSRPIHNKLIHSTVTLTKTDLTGASTVPGALIEVKNSSGETIYREITDENGEIPDIPVTPGCYTFTEVLAPNGYALNEAVMSFEVDAEGNVSGQTVIRDDYSRVVLLKKDGYGQPLEGVVFALVDANDKEIMTAKSNENGEVIFERIPFGKFIIRESQPLPGYKASDVEVELSIDGTFVNPSVPIATITNQLMVLNGVKLDNSGNPHGGAEFCLINAVTGDVVDTATSNADGTFSMSNFEIGYWVLRETKAPEGFSLMKDIDLTVDEFWSEEDVVKCVNIPNHYSFMKINHYWQPLAGVKFAIEDESGNKVQEAISGEDGVVTFTNLNPGTYLIREIEALYGYTRSDETLSVTIDADYMPPKKLKRMVNYPDIETGIDLIFTPTMLMGSFVAILGIAGAVLYRRHMKKKRK